MNPGGAQVELLLAPPLAQGIGADLAPVVEATERELAALAEELGVPAPRSVEARVDDSQALLGVSVDEIAHPYPLALTRCVWRQTVRASLADVVLTGASPTETVEEVLTRHASGPEARGEDLNAYVAALTREILRASPGALVASAPNAQMLADLLDIGVSLSDREALTSLLDDLVAAGFDADEAVEEAWSRLCRRDVEVLVHPESWEELTRLGIDAAPRDIVDEAVAEDLRSGGEVVRQWLENLGVVRRIMLFSDETISPHSVRVRVNDRIGPELPLARPGEVAVQVSPGKIEAAGIAGRPLIDPASGHRLTAVPDTYRAALERMGHSLLSPAAYLAVTVGRELAPLAYRLICVDEVERDLADLEETHSTLVHATLRYFSCGKLTRVLRRLLAEQISIRDTWMILNLLLSYDAVAFDDPAVRVFDDRLPVADPSDPTIGNLVEFIRLRMPDRVAHDSGLTRDEPLGAPLPVFTTDPSLERLLWPQEVAEHGDAGERVRLSVRQGLARSGAAADPVVVTAPAVRPLLREALAAEFPSVRILAQNELPPEITVRATATIGAA